ncbi:hypothetical protein MKW98_030526 [Papaver atlanticum]|uniref:Protein kinase domain-containing protein n=1 Tax=Papaver atlanticum TaxID=357466 RepID=A0AAD4XT57_9MAGN|nr:hypothetical protein MKW98_030526 [Papaver atlanticum]
MEGVMNEKALGEFKSEIAFLKKIRHRHLVVLLGYCLDGNERLLVFEYMPKETLSHHLGGVFDPLDWTRRLSIALDVARGVEYLHGLAQPRYIHRYLKSDNILLNDAMTAKVADFGLVLNAASGSSFILSKFFGTVGYADPEHAGNSHFFLH